MHRSFEHDSRFASHSQANNIHNPSSFISESDKSNLFSFNSNELDIFDLSTDIYDLPQNNLFSPDNSFVLDQQSSSNSNSNKSNVYQNPSTFSSLHQNRQLQESDHLSNNNFDRDVVASINLLTYKNKSQKNEDFNTLKDYDTSPEGYIDYNKNPETDDILDFERKNLHIKNHQIKMKDDDNEKEKENKNSKTLNSEPLTQKRSFFGLIENSFFTDFPENVFGDSQNHQNQKQFQTEGQSESFSHDFTNGKSYYNQTLFSGNQQSQYKIELGSQPQIQSMPQFNMNSIPNLQFTSPSSTNDLYQYHSNVNSILHPTIQYQNQFQIPNQNQRSSTAPIATPIMMSNPITSSTSTIPIDFSLGSAVDDPNTLLALSTQSFNMAMSNRSLVFQPMTLSFEPYEYWLFQERSLSFNDLVCKFFRHNKTNFTKFMYKLYDMLRITTVFPSLKQAVGVYFINDVAISVDKYAMINMLSLNPKNVDGSLFHKQGNFPTHGFIEVTSENYKEAGFTKNPVYKSKSIRILFNKDHKFVNKVMSTAELDAIAYENKSKKAYKRK